jgi:hypothetical protein
MKNIIQIIPMLACMLCLALTVQAEEWVNLFNGKDLSGWQTTGNWKVEEDGVLSLTPRPGEEGWQRYDAYLTTEKQFRDSILDLEFRIPPKGNSGVFVRIEDPKDPVKTGIEVQVMDSYGVERELGHHDNGGVIGTVGPTKNMSKPAGEWNRMIVTCKGSNMKVELNGEQIIDVDLSETPMKDRPLEGYISLQDHGLPISFRNIRIQEIQPEN